MQSTLLFSAALLAATASAQSIDVSLGQQVASQNAALEASITANPAFQSDLSALAAVAPSSVIAALAQAPDAVIDALATATGLLTTGGALPTDALDSLASIAAVPIEIAEDVASYVAAAIADPRFPAAQSVIATALPSAVQSIIQDDPAAVLGAAITASGTPPYLSTLPTAIQVQLASFINGGLQIIASDLAAPAPTVPKYNSTPSMTTSGTAKNTSASGSTATPTPFTGAASAINGNTIGAAFIVVGTVMLALL